MYPKGWEDVSLASEGVKEAVAAGKLLKDHGFTFDVVYTRFALRDIKTQIFTFMTKYSIRSSSLSFIHFT